MAVIAVDIADQGFRRTEPGLGRRGRKAGQQNHDRCENPVHSDRLYLHPAQTYLFQAYLVCANRCPPRSKTL
jgi:hypothetical protein